MSVLGGLVDRTNGDAWGILRRSKGVLVAGLLKAKVEQPLSPKVTELVLQHLALEKALVLDASGRYARQMLAKGLDPTTDRLHMICIDVEHLARLVRPTSPP